MYSILLLCWSSHVLSAMLGGMAVFYLYYTVVLGDPSLLTLVIQFGGPAIVIGYCQNKYLKE